MAESSSSSSSSSTDNKEQKTRKATEELWEQYFAAEFAGEEEFRGLEKKWNEIRVSGRQLGKGGQGFVRRGWFEGRLVAVKVFELAANAKKVFVTEVAALYRTRKSPHIVDMLGYGWFWNEKMADWQCFCLLQLVKGSMDRYVGILSAEMKFWCLLDVARGVEYLHTQISPAVIHRDIKPANALLTCLRMEDKTENGAIAILCDFGLACTKLQDLRASIGEEEEMADRTMGAGTPGFTPPEVLRSQYDKFYDVKVDSYSYGVLVCVLVMRKYPFVRNGRKVFHRKPEQEPDVTALPKLLQPLVKQCLSFDAEARPSFEGPEGIIDQLEAMPKEVLLKELEAAALVAGSLDVEEMIDISSKRTGRRGGGPRDQYKMVGIPSLPNSDQLLIRQKQQDELIRLLLTPSVKNPLTGESALPLVCLAGMGGLGKSILASLAVFQLAHTMVDAGPDAPSTVESLVGQTASAGTRPQAASSASTAASSSSSSSSSVASSSSSSSSGEITESRGEKRQTRSLLEEKFPDGCFWLTLGSECVDDKLLLLQNQLIAFLVGETVYRSSPIWHASAPLEAAQSIKEASREKFCLIVLDDVWRKDQLAAFTFLQSSCTLLVTSRNVNLLDGIRNASTRTHQLPMLSEDETIEMLQKVASTESLRESIKSSAHSTVKKIANLCGNLPLKIAMVAPLTAEAIRKCEDNTDPLTALQTELEAMRSGITTSSSGEMIDPSGSVLNVIKTSVSNLPNPSDEQRYLELAYFEEDERVPINTVGLLWQATAGMDMESTMSLLELFVGRSLMFKDKTGGFIYLHDLHHEFVRHHYVNKSKELKELGTKLFAAYQASSVCQLHEKWDVFTYDGWFYEGFKRYDKDAYEELSKLHWWKMGQVLDRAIRGQDAGLWMETKDFPDDEWAIVKERLLLLLDDDIVQIEWCVPFILCCYYLRKEGNKSEDAFNFAKIAADRGHAWSQRFTGWCYAYLQKNYELGVRYIQMAIDQEFLPAYNLMADLLIGGKGTEKDVPRALELLVKAATAGDDGACHTLGWLHHEGKSVATNMPLAARLFQLAAAKGNVDSNFLFGHMLYRGIGIKQDKKVGFEIWNSLADKGHYYSKLNVAFTWLTNPGVEDGTDEDAFKLLQEANAQLEADGLAQLYLGRCHATGRGTPKDLEKAITCYELSMEKKYIGSYYMLSHCYRRGEGVPKDEAKAEELLKQGDAQEATAEHEFLASTLFDICEEGAPAEHELIKWHLIQALSPKSSAGHILTAQRMCEGWLKSKSDPADLHCVLDSLLEATVFPEEPIDFIPELKDALIAVADLCKQQPKETSETPTDSGGLFSMLMPATPQTSPIAAAKALAKESSLRGKIRVVLKFNEPAAETSGTEEDPSEEGGSAPSSPNPRKKAKGVADVNEPFLNAQLNLQLFGAELGLTDLKFDDNNTCILGIDDEFSLHLTFEPNSKRLYMYSPLLDGLPSDPLNRLQLYEKLLEGSMLGGKMAGGGVGVAAKEELILMHCTIDMAHANPDALKAFAPLYVETIEKWRKTCKELTATATETTDGDTPDTNPTIDNND